MELSPLRAGLKLAPTVEAYIKHFKDPPVEPPQIIWTQKSNGLPIQVFRAAPGAELRDARLLDGQESQSTSN